MKRKGERNMAETLKLGEISKSIKITNKDIIARLAEYGVELKSASSVINEEIAGLILDIYTQSNAVTEEEILELRADALAKAEKEEPKEKKNAPEEKDIAEEKEKTEDKPKKSESDEKTEAAVKKEEKAKPEKHKKVAKKQTGQKFDLINLDHSNTYD